MLTGGRQLGCYHPALSSQYAYSVASLIERFERFRSIILDCLSEVVVLKERIHALFLQIMDLSFVEKLVYLGLVDSFAVDKDFLSQAF